VTPRFRELESSALHAGLGVRLVDDHTGRSAIGWITVELDIDDAGVWRNVERPSATTDAGVIWFPWLEHYRDARGLPARKYRVRVAAASYVPLYSYDSEGIEVLVEPYDDYNAPAALPDPIAVTLLPLASYPFLPELQLTRGIVRDAANAPVEGALVEWQHPALVTDRVLTDQDGEYVLPLRRAPATDPAALPPVPPITVRAKRGALLGSVAVQIAAGLSSFQTIQIV
jgi:hypothetical protein